MPSSLIIVLISLSAFEIFNPLSLKTYPVAVITELISPRSYTAFSISILTSFGVS